VINVFWADAQEYAGWLSRKTGKSYRLLTEAEWEYAARAGTSTPFSPGATITPDQANFDGDFTYGGSAKGTYRQKTIEVGSFKANAFGLHDVHGNVWEWVEDCDTSYANAPPDGTKAPDTANCSHVLRGGSWYFSPRSLRSANRIRYPPDYRIALIGFRLARTLQDGARPKAARLMVRVISSNDALLGDYVSLGVRDSMHGVELAPAGDDRREVYVLAVTGRYASSQAGSDCPSYGEQFISYVLSDPSGIVVAKGEERGAACLRDAPTIDKAKRLALSNASDSLIASLNKWLNSK